MIELAPRSILGDLEDVWLYCITLYHNNKSDWRLPATEENEYNFNQLYGWHRHQLWVNPVRDMIQIGLESQHELTIEEAFLYCITLNYKGYSDWRLPTIGEVTECSSWRTSSNKTNWDNVSWEYRGHYPCVPVRTK